MRGLWWLENVGKAPVFVNGNAVQRFASCELTGFGLCLFVGGCECDCLYVYVCAYVCVCAHSFLKGEPVFQACACAHARWGLRSVPRAASSAARCRERRNCVIQSSNGVCIAPREPVCVAQQGLRSQCRSELRPLLSCGTASAELAAACDWGVSLATSDPCIAI